MAVIYASIPYKTPWCVLGFLHGFILLAGVGASRLLAVPSARVGKALVGALLGAAVIHLGWLAWAGSVRFASDPRNPYVYAHTGTGVSRSPGASRPSPASTRSVRACRSR